MINEDEYIAYSFDTSNIKYETEAGNLSRHTAKTLADLQNIVRGLEKTIRSSTGEKGFNINRNLISVDPSSETGSFRFFVKKDYEKIIDEAVRYFEGKAGDLLGDAKHPLSSTMQKENAHSITYQNRIAGTKAQNEMIIEANKAGGKAEKLGGIDDKMQVTLFVTDSDLKNKSETDILNETFSGSLALSNKELQTRKAKADLKQKANLEDLENDFHTDPDELDTMVNKMMAKAETDEQKKKEDDERKKEKEETAHTQAVKSTLRKIVALLTGAVAILGKILSTAVNWAINATQTRIEAGNLEMTYEQLREKEILDISKNLPKGTHTGAYQDIQTAFGDITHLNQEALGTLGRVMGSGINTMVMSGMGADNPQGIAESILNSFFKQFLEGKNSLNEYVGQDTARRELVTVLKKISPNLATILSKMMDDWSSGRSAKSFDDYEGWTRTTRLMPSVDPYTLTLSADAEKSLGEIKGILAAIKDVYLSSMLVILRPLFQALSSSRIGLTSEQKLALDEANAKSNAESIAYFTKEKARYGSENSVENKIKAIKSGSSALMLSEGLDFETEAKTYAEELRSQGVPESRIELAVEAKKASLMSESLIELYRQKALMKTYDTMISKLKDKKGNPRKDVALSITEADVAQEFKKNYMIYVPEIAEVNKNSNLSTGQLYNTEEAWKADARLQKALDPEVFKVLAQEAFNRYILPGIEPSIKQLNSVEYMSAKDDTNIHFTVNFIDKEGKKQTKEFTWNALADFEGSGNWEQTIYLNNMKSTTSGGY